MAANVYPIKRKGTYLYKCDHCGKQWMKKNSLGGASACPKCRNVTHPKQLKRWFGEFVCGCGNTWSSGHSWEEIDQHGVKVLIKQQCRDCKNWILPHTTRPLRKGAGGRGPPHMQEYCGLCKKLGRNCTEINTGSDNEDDDDTQSVISTISYVSDITDTLTPTGSDNEGSHCGSDPEDDLADNLKNLKF